MEDLENAVKWYIETGNYRDIMAKNRLDKRCFKRKNGYIRLLKVFMRRFGFLVVFLPLLFLGCDVVSYSIVLTNATETKTVFYTYNGTRNSLAPQETRLYEVGAWTQPPVNVEDEHGIASINVVTNGMTGDHTFVYVRPIILEVKNTLPVNATIRAGNFIDNGGLMELYVSTGETETAIIYTENPNFTMTGNFPANFGVNIITLTCECEDDPENDFKCIRDNDELEDIWDNSERRPQRKMYVTIR